MLKRNGLSLFIILLFLVSLGCALAADDPARASPVIVEKPLLVVPGEPLNVTVYNGGHDVWTDLAVSVAQGPAGVFRGVIEPEGFATVPVDVPLVYLLDAPELPVTLSYRHRVLDARSLPLEVLWPREAVIADPYAPGGPELLVLVDASGFDRVLGGVQVEVSLLKDGKESFVDYYGPFYLSPSERFVWSTPLPERYLSAGDYEVRATFYEGGRFLAETTSSFAYEGPSSSSWGGVLLLVLCVLLLVLVYVAVDMVFHGRRFRESLSRLR